MKRLVEHVKTHRKLVHAHLKKHHKKYFFGVLSAALLIKLIPAMIAGIATWHFNYSFADEVELSESDILLLGEGSSLFGYDSSHKVTVNSISTGSIVLESPILYDDLDETIEDYILLYSRYSFSELAENTSLLPQFSEKLLSSTGTSDTKIEMVMDTNLNVNTIYYVTVLPSNKWGMLGNVSNEICFRLKDQIYGEGQDCVNGGSASTSGYTASSWGNAIALANVSCTWDGAKVTFNWIPTDIGNVKVSVYTEETQNFDIKGIVNMSQERSFSFDLRSTYTPIIRIDDSEGLGVYKTYTCHKLLSQESGSIVVPSTIDGVRVLTICNPKDETECITMMDRNLGATTNNIYSTGSYGYLYQWGNNYGFISCYENGCSTFPNTGNISSTRVNTDTTSGYSGSIFILPTSSPYDWADPSNNNLWGGSGDDTNGGVYSMSDLANRQGPCPEGFHVPSQREMRNVLEYRAEGNGVEGYEPFHGNYAPGDINMNFLKFQSDFKIPFAGGYTYNSNHVSEISEIGRSAFLWLSTPMTNGAANFHLSNNSSSAYGGSWRTSAYPIRCFKDPECLPSDVTITSPISGNYLNTKDIQLKWTLTGDACASEIFTIKLYGGDNTGYITLGTIPANSGEFSDLSNFNTGLSLESKFAIFLGEDKLLKESSKFYIDDMDPELSGEIKFTKTSDKAYVSMSISEDSDITFKYILSGGKAGETLKSTGINTFDSELSKVRTDLVDKIYKYAVTIQDRAGNNKYYAGLFRFSGENLESTSAISEGSGISNSTGVSILSNLITEATSYSGCKNNMKFKLITQTIRSGYTVKIEVPEYSSPSLQDTAEFLVEVLLGTRGLSKPGLSGFNGSMINSFSRDIDNYLVAVKLKRDPDICSTKFSILPNLHTATLLKTLRNYGIIK